MEINDFRSYLPGPVFQHLRNARIALDEGQHFASAIWGAVFLEAFLEVLLNELGVPKALQDDLQGRIQQLNNYMKNRSPEKPSVPDDVVKRCNDIRNTRNRLVHDTGLAKVTLVQDAEFIFAGLRAILDWYRLVSIRRCEAPIEGLPNAEVQGIPVFLSTITPGTERESYFLGMFESKLRGIGIRAVRAEVSIYDRKDPIGKIRKIIKGCEAGIVLGLERSHAYFLKDREGTCNEKEEIHRKYTSGWLHLEAGMVNALGMDLFVLCQKDIYGDGIFDRGWNSYSVVELPTLDENSPQLRQFLDHLREWVAAQEKAAE